MVLNQALQEDLCLKLKAVGLEESVMIPLVQLIVKQVAAEGPENVVKRLKVIKQAAISHIAGNTVHLPWVAHTAKGLKGPWKPVWKWLLSSRYKLKVRALNTMMVYAALVLPKETGPSPTQEYKFLSSVEVPPNVKREREDKVRSALIDDQALRQAVYWLKSHLQEKGWNPDQRGQEPEIWSYLGRRYGSERADVRKAEKVVQTFLGRQNFYAFHPFPQVLSTLGQYAIDYQELTHPYNGFWLDYKQVQPTCDAIGVVGFTQEPGCKFRAFASPNWVLQAALEPMKQLLLSALKKLSWDSTHDQSKGVSTVKSWLEGENVTFSVDLSDATNNFPWYFQERVLNVLGLSQDDIRLLWMVSKSGYQLTWGDRRNVQWSVGQPLGAGPSFMSFALSHAVVAIAAEIRAGVPTSDLGSHFCILGDDIVINDSKVHDFYRYYLGQFSCPVSESKCLVSAVASEFAGKLITRDQVYHGFKFRDVSDLSFLDVVRSLGPQSVKILTPPQRAYAELVWEIPAPYGLGFNPSGRPLAERYADYLRLVDAFKQEEPDNNVFRIEEVRNRVVYNLRCRMWSYFPHRGGARHQVAATQYAVTRTGIMQLIRQSELVSFVEKRGDPRVSPIEGWSYRILSKVLPLIRSSKRKVDS